MNIKDIIEANEREFKEKFTYGVLYSASSDLSAGKGIHFKTENAEGAIKWLHQSQLKLLEGVRAEIMKLKVFTGGGSVNDKDKRIIRQDIINLLSIPETNNKEI